MKRIVLLLSIAMTWASAQDFLTIGSGGTNAVYFQVASGIARLINEANVGVRVSARSTSGGVSNLSGLASSDLEMGLSQSDLASYAWNGKVIPAFVGKPLRNIKAIGNLYPEFVQVLARADQNIAEISDLKGKRVVIGPEGSGNAENARQILQVYGLSLGDIQPIQVSASQALALMQDDKADAVFFSGGLEAPALVGLSEAIKTKLLPIDFAHTRSLIKANPFYRITTIPGGLYAGNPVSQPGVALYSIWLVRDTLSADLVYQMIKATFDNPQFLGLHPNLKRYFDLKQALYNLPIPLHPGAERFYREKGLLK